MANVKLSKDEFELVTSAQFILTKNAIIKKVYELFGDLSQEYMNIADIGLPQEVLSISPKIAKGENYRELPWVMLDYPRNFSQQNVFAIRSFFWWGNFFSITLQVQGFYKEAYQSMIMKNFSNGWWYCINANDAWQHHFEETNYKKFDPEIDINKLPFIKLAKKIPLQEWDNAFDFYLDSFKEIVGLLTPQTMK